VPLASRTRELALQSGGQPYAGQVDRAVGQPEAVHLLEMPAQVAYEARRQHRAPVLVAFAAAHHDLTAVEVEVVDAQAERLEKPQTTAVEQRCDQALPPQQAG